MLAFFVFAVFLLPFFIGIIDLHSELHRTALQRPDNKQYRYRHRNNNELQW